MAGKEQKVQSTDEFFQSLRTNLVRESAQPVGKAQTSGPPDSELAYFRTPAPNIIEWATRPEFLNIPRTYEFWRQYQVLRDLFQLRCPLSTCNDQSPEAKDCWGKSRAYLESENLLVYSDAHKDDVCPRCGTTRMEFVADGLLDIYNQCHGVVGMRSGKTATAGIIGTYVEHRLTNIGLEFELGEFFGQLKGQPLEVTFIASTDVQSSDTVWAYFTNMRANGTWHQKYIKYIKAQEAKQNTANGMKPWQYLETNKVIEHGNFNLRFKSLNSNSGGMAGRTRPAAFMDEVARFDNGQSARSADEAYRVLENSLRTLRSTALRNAAHHARLAREGLKPIRPVLPWLGLMVSISSPISAEDKAMRLLKVAPEIPNMYYFHYPTWEFNPFEPYENFAGDFAKDHDGAMRDFGANPPAAANPLISDPKSFRDMAIAKDLRPTSYFLPYVHTDRLGKDYMGIRMNSSIMLRDSERYICFDAGQSFDQFAGACAHGEWVDTKDGRQLITVFDWVLRILPSQVPKREVWFDSVMQIIEELRKFQRIAMIDFDRWQSTYLIQQIRDLGVPSQMSGTKAEDFVKLVADVKFSRVKMLPPIQGEETIPPQNMSAETVQFYELERLERSSDLKKVFNPRKGKIPGANSDDVAQVVAHCNRMVQNTIADISDSNTQENRLHREQVGGTSWGTRGSLHRPRFNTRGW